jgi:hypothetical protein
MSDPTDETTEQLEQLAKRKALDAALARKGVTAEGKKREVLYSELVPRLDIHEGEVVARDEAGDFMGNGKELAGPEHLVDEITEDEEWTDILDVSAEGSEEPGDEDEETQGDGRPQVLGGPAEEDPEKAQRARELNGRAGKPWVH